MDKVAYRRTRLPIDGQGCPARPTTRYLCSVSFVWSYSVTARLTMVTVRFFLISGMKKSHIAIIAGVFVVVIIAIAVSVGVVLSKKDDSHGADKISYKPFPAAKYSKAAVATDSEICSKVCVFVLLYRALYESSFRLI